MPFDGRILSGVTVLAAVVEGGSFVKAAELIGITDSGVSRAISRLEARLGIPYALHHLRGAEDQRDPHAVEEAGLVSERRRDVDDVLGREPEVTHVDLSGQVE